ncbi:MAG: hypothetical protein ABR559_00450 [Gemmatimonadota bacterium]
MQGNLVRYVSRCRHQLAWWDALIVAFAQLAGCRYLLSEDFSDSRDFDGLG